MSWKSKLKAAFPNPNDYSEFMGAFSACTGTVTLFMMLLSRRIFKVLGWGFAALVTPTVIAATGGVFFGLLLFSSQLSPLVTALGTTPLMLAVIVGALQNIFSKSAKYSYAIPLYCPYSYATPLYCPVATCHPVLSTPCLGATWHSPSSPHLP